MTKNSDASATSPELSQTYLGTFDDVVERYPWKTPINNNYLSQTLARHVLLGDRVILNDGYLIQQSLALDALKQENKSPLFNMIWEGQVRLISADGDIVGSLRKRAESGVETIRQVVDSNDWPQLETVLTAISKRQHQLDAHLRFPSLNMGAGFHAAMSRLKNEVDVGNFHNIGLTHTDEDLFRNVYDRFNQSIDHVEFAAARTIWENASKATIAEASGLSSPREALNELMGVANEGYHMNFASALTSDNDFVVGVETNQSEAFNEFLEEPELLTTSLPEIESIPLPNDKAFRDPQKLQSFMMSGMSGHVAKMNYLTAQQTYILDPSEANREAYREQKDAYVRKIAEVFGTGFRLPFRQRMASIYVATLGVAASAAGLDPSFGVAPAALAFISDQWLAPHYLKKYAIDNLETWLKDRDNGYFQKKTSKFQSSGGLRSVALDKQKSLALTKDLPKYQ